jgi:hypothetical protein
MLHNRYVQHEAVCYTSQQKCNQKFRVIAAMQRKTKIKDQCTGSGRFSSYGLKIGAIFLLLLLSILVAACGASDTQVTTADEPTPVATINLGNPNSTPTPGLPPDWCGIWVTNSSPPISQGSLNIYAKFVQNKDGNPVGIAGAQVSLTIDWGDGAQEPLPTLTTSSTGLVTYPANIGMHGGAMNKLSLITGTFSSGSANCSVDNSRPASFVIVAGAVGTPTPKKGGKTGNGGNNGDNNGDNNGGIPGFPGFPSGQGKKP